MRAGNAHCKLPPGMTSRTKRFLAILMIAAYGIQLGHTVYNKVNWPFCSHNFYYHRSSLVKDLFRITLIDDLQGEVVVDPRHVLPIEGYRCGAIFREVFINNTSTSKKESFARSLLTRLNQGAWMSFDERFAPVKPLKGQKFVGLVVQKHWIDTREYPKSHELPVIKKETIYTLKSD